MDFNKGLKDGIPVALGYFSVSIAFGLMAIENECSALEAVLISVTNLTSAGQFAGVTVLAAMGTYVEMAMTQLVINSRYSLMAISLSQKVDGKFRGVWKWLLGFAITDEIFAVAIGHDGSISKEYFSGLISLPILGWSAGTLFGAVLGNIMPEIITTRWASRCTACSSPLLYRKRAKMSRADHRDLSRSRSARDCLRACIFGISSGFAIIISAVIASVAGRCFSR